MTFVGFPTESVVWQSKKTLRTTSYFDIATRAFCTDCGSNVYMQYTHKPYRIGFLIGMIDESSLGDNLEKLRPEKHIFVGEGKKASWFDVPDDGLSRWDGFEASFQEILEAAQKSAKESSA
jgi:hypothetical protein